MGATEDRHDYRAHYEALGYTEKEIREIMDKCECVKCGGGRNVTCSAPVESKPESKPTPVQVENYNKPPPDSKPAPVAKTPDWVTREYQNATPIGVFVQFPSGGFGIIGLDGKNNVEGCPRYSVTKL